MPQRFITTLPWWLLPLIIAVALRAVVLASGAVSFHSDEAIVGLMARHINQGQPIPTFFYGQHYMGSLDPLLVAGAFRLLGESVLSIRLVQSALYLCVIVTTMILALRVTGNRWIAGTAGLLVAVPPVVMTLYTTISLGGYGETLVIGNLLLLVSHEIAAEKREECPARKLWLLWLALGALIGLGWWTNSLIVAYLPAVGVLLIGYLIRCWRHSSKGIAPEELLNFLRVLIGFVVFSGPWWLYNLNHDWASVRFLVGGFQPASGLLSVGIGDRLIGLLLLGLPAVIGARYSWSMTPWMGMWIVPYAIFYGALLASSLSSRAVRFLWAMVIGFATIFVGSSFGIDATGRYLLPLIVPLAIIIAAQIHALRQRFELATILVVLLIGVNLIGTVIAIRTLPPGLTPQFDAATDFPNDHDQAVIDFLLENGGQYGYATYWATYRLAFLSGERVTLTPMLPYKASLVYTPTDRYTPYTAAVAQAERPVFVTANLPRLDTIIAERLRDKSITFSQRTLGPFTVFYNLSQRVTPLELGLQNITDG